MKKTGIYGYVYDFSVDYDAVSVDEILDTQNYLMKKKKWHSVIKMFGKMCRFTGLALLSLTSVNLLSCISMDKNVK